MSPFFRSTVDPISTSLVSFFRIDVLSTAGTMELAPSAGTSLAPVGTAVFPPHADVARSTPATKINTRLLNVGILSFAPNSDDEGGSKYFLHRLQERATETLGSREATTAASAIAAATVPGRALPITRPSEQREHRHIWKPVLFISD
jgi:hypothetical protein